MENLLKFITDNYIWFLIITLVLIFILIGYLVDITNPKTKPKNKVKTIAKVSKDDEKKHPSIAKYYNDEFDDPLIK